MSSRDRRIKAVYSDYSAFIEAVETVARRKGVRGLEVFSPMPLHEMERILPQKPSGVRWFTFLGGLTGLSFGLLFPIYTVLDWPLITGGKPIVSLPLFIVVAFELTILFGALATFLGLLVLGKMPRQNLTGYDPRFSECSFGIVFIADKGDAGEFRRLLDKADDFLVAAAAGNDGEKPSP